jgi:hypothetical protein
LQRTEVRKTKTFNLKVFFEKKLFQKIVINRITGFYEIEKSRKMAKNGQKPLIYIETQE